MGVGQFAALVGLKPSRALLPISAVPVPLQFVSSAQAFTVNVGSAANSPSATLRQPVLRVGRSSRANTCNA